MLGLAALATAAEAVRTYKAKDQFDSSPSQKALKGRAFLVELTPRESGFDRGCGDFPSWSYDASKGELRSEAFPNSVLGLSTIPTDAFPNIPGTQELNSVPFVCQRVSQSAAKASNAYGATTIVRRSVEETLSFSTRNYFSARTDPSWTAHVEGSDARELARAIRVRITGVLGEWKPGQTIVCYTDKSEATMDMPFERTTHDCMFKTESIRFEIIDNRTRSVLHAWE